MAATKSGILPWTGSLLLVSRARALYALERIPEAHAAIVQARDNVLRIAATLSNPALRESFLRNVDANAQTLELADGWLKNPA